ncbi:putative copper-exporting P-type ATPase V [compost metagenome]
MLLSNRLDSLVHAFALARRTRRVIIENLVWAGLYNGLMLPFAALGWLTPVWAAVGMSISSLTVVLNALRLTRVPQDKPEPRQQHITDTLPASAASTR